MEFQWVDDKKKKKRTNVKLLGKEKFTELVSKEN